MQQAADKHYMPGAKQPTDKVSDHSWLNIVEHLAAKEPDIPLRSCWTPTQD